jgi:hypothetical protein
MAVKLVVMRVELLAGWLVEKMVAQMVEMKAASSAVEKVALLAV